MQFKARSFTLRTRETYDYHCSLLDGALCKEDSVTYGVNYASPLNDIDNFHVVDHLPQDIMHVLLEGVIPYELSHMLICFVVEKKFLTGAQINDRIESFAYSTLEAKDKPSPIKAQVFSSRGASLSQSCECYNNYTSIFYYAEKFDYVSTPYYFVSIFYHAIFSPYCAL